MSQNAHTLPGHQPDLIQAQGPPMSTNPESSGDATRPRPLPQGHLCTELPANNSGNKARIHLQSLRLEKALQIFKRNLQDTK